MNGENTKRPMNASTVIVWQVLGFFCSALGCSMGTGLELVFCALAAAFCGCLWQVQRSVLAGLGTLAGGLCFGAPPIFLPSPAPCGPTR